MGHMVGDHKTVKRNRNFGNLVLRLPDLIEIKPLLVRWISSKSQHFHLSNIGLCNEEIWDFDKLNSLPSQPFRACHRVDSVGMRRGYEIYIVESRVCIEELFQAVIHVIYWITNITPLCK